MLKQLFLFITALMLEPSAYAGDSVVLQFKAETVSFSQEAYAVFEKSRTARWAVEKLILRAQCDPSESGLTRLELDQMYACVVKNKPNNLIIFSRYNGNTSFMSLLREGQPSEAYFVELLTPGFLKKVEDSTLYQKHDGGGNRRNTVGPRAPHQPSYVTRQWFRIKLIGDTNPAEFRIIDAEIRRLEIDLNELQEDLREIDREIQRLVDTRHRA